MKNAVAKIQNSIDTVGIQVQSGFQVRFRIGFINWLLTRGYTSETEFKIRWERYFLYVSSRIHIL
jgi:hypothetical protein